MQAGAPNKNKYDFQILFACTVYIALTRVFLFNILRVARNNTMYHEKRAIINSNVNSQKTEKVNFAQCLLFFFISCGKSLSLVFATVRIFFTIFLDLYFVYVYHLHTKLGINIRRRNRYFYITGILKYILEVFVNSVDLVTSVNHSLTSVQLFECLLDLCTLFKVNKFM